MRQQLSVVFLFAVLLSVSLPSNATAVPITYKWTGSSAGGSLDGERFGPVSFSIFAVGDTDEVGFEAGLQRSLSDQAFITIDGIGTLEFLSTTGTLLSFRSNRVSFTRGGPALSVLFEGPFRPPTTPGDLVTGFGPIDGFGRTLGWQDTGSPVLTNAGPLEFDPLPFSNSPQPPATFEAVVDGRVPEVTVVPPIPLPGTLLPLFSALLAFFAVRSRRTAHSPEC